MSGDEIAGVKPLLHQETTLFTSWDTSNLNGCSSVVEPNDDPSLFCRAVGRTYPSGECAHGLQKLCSSPMSRVSVVLWWSVHLKETEGQGASAQLTKRLTSKDTTSKRCSWEQRVVRSSVSACDHTPSRKHRLQLKDRRESWDYTQTVMGMGSCLLL